jgi:peptidyl-prolyl cis-trans isomerase SurA
VIFFCSDAAVARTLHDQLKKDPTAWKKLTETLSEKVVTDSSRYEWEQVPGLNKTTPKPGMLTLLTANPTDNSASFAYVIKIYTESSPRTFNEARGLVMNDYQALLEEQWIQSLRKKYPVVIDQKVLAAISK